VKLLLDENLSHGLLAAVEPICPGSTHVRLVGLERADDDTIWRYADQHGYCIVTQDADFVERALLQGTPPPVLCLRVGNTATANMRDVLLRVLPWFLDWVATNPPPHVCEIE